MERCGLLGQKLAHSFSPAIHARLGNYPYERIELEPDELPAFLARGEFHGLNVTIPYKKTVIPFLHELSPRAKNLGSVNTILKRPDGSLWGGNTDWDGFAFLLAQSGLDLRSRKALVLGSGGASVTVRAVLKEAGADVRIISRSGPDNYENLARHADAFLLVNTTPVGMYPNNGAAPLSLTDFPRLGGVIDLIYNPLRTALLLEAEALGIPAFNGLPMLVAQAAESSRIWGFCHDPAGQTARILPDLRRSQENVVLIGMPGSGKSTMARMLGERLHRPVFDSDQEIEKELGMRIPDFFAKESEAAFRRIETRVLARLGAMSGIVLATGGGVVTRPENYPLLHQNGRIIWIRRPLSQLSSKGRPISQSRNLDELYRERAAAYERFADAAADSRPQKKDTLHGILNVLQK